MGPPELVDHEQLRWQAQEINEPLSRQQEAQRAQAAQAESVTTNPSVNKQLILYS